MKKFLLISSIVFLFLSLFLFRHYFSVFYFQNDVNKIAVNVETNKNINDVYICFDSDCDTFEYSDGLYSYKLNQENPMFYDDISNIEIITDKIENLSFINSISLFNGNKYKSYNVSDLKSNEIDFNGSEKISLFVPYETNSKTIIQKMGVYIESLFYNWYFYFISYILLVIYFIKYQPKYNCDYKIILFFILLLGAVLRFSHIDFIPLWNDELYTYTVISDCGNNFNFKNIFLDPGNPPLFFFFSNIWLKFFNNSVFLVRLLPCLIGIFGIYFIYFVVNKILSQKEALVCAFLFSINIFVILESNEIRSYIFSMLLILFGMLCFYKLYKNQNNKNLLYYFLSTFFLVNTHFYCFLFALFNFVSGLFLFKSIRLKYILVNLVSFLTFGIYFLISYKVSLSSTFNTWLAKPTIDVLYNHIVFYFGNIIFFILTITFLFYVFKRFSDTEKFIVKYIISSVLFVFIASYIISWTLKPILFERYFCIFIPLGIIVSSVCLCVEYKSKFKPLILCLIFLVSLNMAKYENFNLFSNIYFMVKYSTSDYNKYINNDTDIFFIIPDNIKYINYFEKEFEKIDVSKIVISNNGVKENIDMIDEYVQNSRKKRVIIYLPEICTNQLVKKKYKPKKIVTSILPVYKIIVIK